MFAVAMTLVVLVSTAMLLYQFWSGSLLADDHDAAPDPQAVPDAPAPGPTLYIDHAA